MAKYALTDGNRINLIFNWDGTSPNPYPGSTPKKLPDNASAEWIGKSYDEAVKAGNTAKDAKGELHPAKDIPEGKRAEELKALEAGLHASGDALNSQMGEATMALEHPLDPVLGSEMRTPQPELHVAFVPASQPKTAAQSAKDAGQKVDAKAGRHDPAPDADDEGIAPNTAAGRAATAARASDSTDKRKEMAGLK